MWRNSKTYNELDGTNNIQPHEIEIGSDVFSSGQKNMLSQTTVSLTKYSLPMCSITVSVIKPASKY